MLPFHVVFDWCLCAQTLLAIGFFASALCLAGNAYAGFNVVLTALVFALIIPVSFQFIRKSTSQLLYGFTLGVLFVITVVALETAVFWGEYSSCTPVAARTPADSSALKISSKLGVDCGNRTAMTCACVFASGLFVLYLAQILVLVLCKDEVLQRLVASCGACD